MNIRVPLRLPVTMEFPPGSQHRALPAVTTDMSFDGAFIRHGGPPPEKGVVARLTLYGAEGPFVINVLVLRSDEHGVGVMFGHYDNDVFDHLAALMEPELERHFVPNLAHGASR